MRIYSGGGFDPGRERLDRRQTSGIKVTHGLLVDRTNLVERFHGLKNGGERVAAVVFSHPRQCKVHVPKRQNVQRCLFESGPKQARSLYPTKALGVEQFHTLENPGKSARIDPNNFLSIYY